MKRLLIILAVIAISVTTSEAAKKRGFFEIATGAWCQWCPESSVQVENLEGAYGDDVVCIKYHYGDGMAYGDISSFGEMFYNAAGVPSMMADRSAYNIGGEQKVMMHPAYAPQIAQNIIAADGAAIDIQSIYEYDAATGIVRGRIKIEILADIAGQLAFNAYLVEDQVTGSGSGFDQKNAFSNNPKYSTHPYYSKPNPIVGYKHDNTVRHMFAGILGDKADLPTTVSAGDVFIWDYSVNKSTVPVQMKMTNIRIATDIHILVGNQLGQVVNCCWATEGDPDDLEGGGSGGSPLVVSAEAELNQVIPATGNANYTFNFSHEGSKTKNVTIAVEKVYAPEGWECEVQNDATALAVPSNTDLDLDFKLKPNGSKGTAIYKLIFTEEGAEESIEYEISATNMGSKRIAIVMTTEDPSTLLSMIEPESFAYVNINDFALDAFLVHMTKMQYVKTAVVSFGNSAAIDAPTVTLVKDLMVDIDVLLAGTNMYSNMIDQTVRTFIETTLGLTVTGQYTDLDGNLEMPFEGMNNDPITDGMTGSLIPDDMNPFIYSVVDASIAKPILAFTEADDPTYFAVRSTTPTAKAVSLGCAFDIMSDDATAPFFAAAIAWLESDVVEQNAVITCDVTEINFGARGAGAPSTGDFKMVEIGNDGEAPLSITSVQLTDEAFVLNTNLPLDIEPGLTGTIDFDFLPTEIQDYTADVTISSNGGNHVISFTGEGIPNAVNEIKNVFTFNAYPNPIVTSSTITFNVLGTARNVKIDLIDLNGKVVSTLVNNLYHTGEFTVDLNVANLAAGTYYAVAIINGNKAMLPLIVK